MQTKQQIQKLLASAGITPNHRRGQNFLIDLNLARMLIKDANIHSSDIVLEVGSGTGSLTEEIVKLAGHLIIAEIDHSLANITRSRLQNLSNYHLFDTDILENKNTLDKKVKQTIVDMRKRYSGKFLLVSNLPYSISCPVMINLVTTEPYVDQILVTVQKEVAQRMTAEPDSKNYGPLSIYLSAFGDVKIIRNLKPSVFWPQPKVNSAFVSFHRNTEKANRIHDIGIFTKVVTLFMQHRRKMLKACVRFTENPLSQIHNFDRIFEDSFVDPHARPETLTSENFISIANICAESLDRK